jgi:hypothetical protein
MGVLWTVLPLNQVAQDWLDGLGIPYPQKPSRLPTGGEIKTVLAGIRVAGGHVEVDDRGVGQFWQATITDQTESNETRWAALTICRYAGDAQPQEIWFEKGSVCLNTEIVRRFTALCGPLVLVPDTGEAPTVIEA